VLLKVSGSPACVMMATSGFISRSVAALASATLRQTKQFARHSAKNLSPD
jgi:hypothetical protein